MVIRRFEVWLVNLDPSVGSEMRKTRPAVIVSPEVTNKHLHTVIVAPLTSTFKPYPTRITCVFQKRNGQIVLDQIRAVDKIRLVKRLGKMDEKTSVIICELLGEIFKY